MMQFDDRRKIGIGITALGAICTVLGVILLFDKGLIAIGNLLFMSGLTVTIGIQATVKFFTRKRNQKGSIIFLVGAALVIYGWAMIGLAIEIYGFWLLFNGFFPTILQFLRKVPGVSSFLDLPQIKFFINKLAPAQTLPL